MTLHPSWFFIMIPREFTISLLTYVRISLEFMTKLIGKLITIGKTVEILVTLVELEILMLGDAAIIFDFESYFSPKSEFLTISF